MRLFRRASVPVYLLAGRIRPGVSEQANEAFSAVLAGATRALRAADLPVEERTEVMEQLQEAVWSAQEWCNPDLLKVLNAYHLVTIGFMGGVCGSRAVEERRQTFILAWRQASGTDSVTQPGHAVN